MAYSGIQYTLTSLTPQELERLKKRAAQELKINLMVVIPSLAFIAVLIFYLNSEYKAKETLMEVINGIGGLAGGLLGWYFVRFLLSFRKDVKNGKKKTVSGIVEGKRIINAGKYNEAHRMLFQKNEFDLTPEIYKMVEKGMKIELHVTEHNERVLAIRKMV